MVFALILLAVILAAVVAVAGLYWVRQRRVTHQPYFEPQRPSEAQIKWIKSKYALDQDVDPRYPNG